MKASSNRSSLWLLLQVLDRKERLRFSIFIPLILVGTALELLSLGLVIPVVQVVLGSNELESYGFLPDSIEDMRYQTFVILLLSILVSAFLLKNLFILGANYYQHRAQLALGNRISQRLFENYLRQPYEYHLMHSSSKLGANIAEYSGAVLYFLGALLLVTADLLTGVGFLVVLLIVQPVSTLVVGVVFGGSAWLVLHFTRPRAREWGRQRIEYRAAINTAILSGFGGVKEIKLFGRDREVIDTHKKSVYGETRTVYLFNVISNIPRTVFEVLAVASVAITVVISKLRDPDSVDATLIVALFGVAAFRMLPSINRIVVSLQQFALSRPGLEGAVDGLSLKARTEEATTDEFLGAFKTLEISNLKYRYPNTEKLVLNIDRLVISPGDSIGVVGSSGSGKSTFVDILIGILPPSEGSVLVNGEELSQCRRQWQDQIGYVPQSAYLMDTTIRRNVAFGLPEKAINDAQVEKALRQAHLWEFVNTLPKGWDTEVGERAIRLSGGQRQRLGIARALYANPQVIVLDEATSALDDATEREIVESFREIAVNHTLIIVAHRTSTLRDCNRVIRLEGGQVVREGSFAEIVGSLPETFDRGQ
jgi:ABC-type multidrug transport system fused ATPase/permease subunit